MSKTRSASILALPSLSRAVINFFLTRSLLSPNVIPPSNLGFNAAIPFIALQVLSATTAIPFGTGIIASTPRTVFALASS